MALMPCRECGKEISSLAHACPHCGAPIERIPSAAAARAPLPEGGVSYLKAALVLSGLALLFSVILIVYASSQHRPEADDRATIDVCWEEYGKKSLDPASKRFIASACEKMESDFKQKYGRDP
ncbi:zinc ribbon domain-containing protein [Pseudoxanthomonas winnipegensis]|uniref:zinc ribbon domain-containing protein n=1 Tax=Pseudoxanthomonas winnipegensis TaxID=2480810 RepID=UPI00102DC9CD|nr:zinc ribbon domain-containing protein [Pseudoxanthomonas winnipegensis]RZZ81955.1 zinc ribbon domain-containing protein [Pseudoxanthomonas winnipegensis]TAA42179.1 zinc ribbon domain-containing protein [Pseudoxanthomonas winnipegensis]